MNSYEDQFRVKYPEARVTEDKISDHLTIHTVWVGEQPVSDSGDRVLAFMHACHDIRDGLLVIHQA